MAYKMKGFSGFKSTPNKKMDYKVSADTLDRVKAAEQAKAKEGQAVSEAIDNITGKVSDTAAAANKKTGSPNKFLGKFMRNTGVGKTLGKAAKYGAFGPLGMAAAAAGGAYKKKGAGNIPQHGDEAHGGGQSQETQGAAEQVAKQQAAVQGEIPTNAPAATGTEEQAPMMKKGILAKGKEANLRKEINDLEDKVSFKLEDINNDRVSEAEGYRAMKTWHNRINKLRGKLGWDDPDAETPSIEEK